MTDISAWLRGALRVKHAWYRLLRLLAARVFHTIVAFQKKSGPGTITAGWIPNKLDSGFQWFDSGFHALDTGFQSRGFRIPQAKISRIPDSGFRITFHRAIQKHYFIQFEWLIKLVHLSFSVSYDFDRENVQMTQERSVKRSNKLSNGGEFEGCDGAKSF